MQAWAWQMKKGVGVRYGGSRKGQGCGTDRVTMGCGSVGRVTRECGGAVEVTRGHGGVGEGAATRVRCQCSRLR